MERRTTSETGNSARIATASMSATMTGVMRTINAPESLFTPGITLSLNGLKMKYTVYYTVYAASHFRPPPPLP